MIDNEKILITSIDGNRQLLDGGSMFGNAPRPVWEKWVNVDSLGRIELACRSLLIQTRGKNILLEAGIGQFFEPKLADRYGVTPNNKHLLKENLEELNISPEKIDYVILSHLHFDHIGGIVPGYEEFSKNPRLLFPNATYFTSKEAYERSLNPHPRDRASFIPEILKLLCPHQNLRLIENLSDLSALPSELSDLFHFHYSHGHTPGQLLTEVKGDSHNILFCGDLIPGRPWVHLPITMGYDRFPELLIDEKKEMYAKLDLEKTLFFYTHDDNYSCSYIGLNEKQKFIPKNSMKQLKKYVL